MIGIEYKGTNGSEYNVFCKTINRTLLPVIRQRETEIYGKSGIIDYGGNDYGIKTMSVKLSYAGNSLYELRSKSREVAAWLNSVTWEKLFFGDEPDKYYLARIKRGASLSNFFVLGEANITFECQPFAYMATKTGTDPTWNEADFPWITDIPWNMIESYQFTATAADDFTFDNPGTQEIGCNSPQGSKFDIVVTGSWTTLELTLNGKTLEYTEAGSGTLAVDNVEMEAKLDGVNKLSALGGGIDSFLSVIPGENTIEIDGTEIDVTVTIDFISMWL